jgi:energy-coupling factor transporter ATP-binding protein EcfA2
MKIESIEFHGFKAKNRFASVDFSKSVVTVIYGDNGCGKTTFLKALNSFLSQDDEALSFIGIYRVLCNIRDEGSIRKVCVERTDDGYDWREFDDSYLVTSKSLSLGVDRGVSTQSIKIDPGVIRNFFSHPRRQHELFGGSIGISLFKKNIYEISEELALYLKRSNASRFKTQRPEIDFEKPHLYLQSIKIENIEEILLRRFRIARFAATRKIQSALFDTLSVAIDVESSELKKKGTDNRALGKRILESKDRIVEALDDGDENKFKNRIVDILGRIDQPGELKKILEHSLLSELFQNMIDELEVEKLMLNSINLLVDRFNTFLINDKRLVVNGKEVYIEIGDEQHSVNELSSGERHILTFLTLVLFEGQGRDFLIIDEPEISLNLRWQRELMSLFSLLLPKTQIIVASHSPALAKRNPDYLSELKVWRD